MTLAQLRASNRTFYASPLLLSEGGLNRPSLRASIINAPSKLARYLFWDGG